MYVSLYCNEISALFHHFRHAKNPKNDFQYGSRRKWESYICLNRKALFLLIQENSIRQMYENAQEGKYGIGFRVEKFAGMRTISHCIKR